MLHINVAGTDESLQTAEMASIYKRAAQAEDVEGSETSDFSGLSDDGN